MFLKKAKTFLSFKLRRIGYFLKITFKSIKRFFSKLKKAFGLMRIWEKRILILFISIFIIGIAFLSRDIYHENTITAPIIGGKITIAEVGEPKSINPIFAKTTQDKEISNLVFSGLFYWNEKRALKPDLVKKYAVSKDKKTYTFYLENEAQWHDGTPLTADDVVFTTSLISDPTYNGPLKGLFENIIFEKVDDKTVKFALKDPYTPFLGHLSFGILPYHILGNVPLDQMEEDAFNLSPTGSGPYKFKKSKLSGLKKQIILERNPRKSKRSGLINEIDFNFYEDAEKAIKAYSQGEATIISDVPNDEIAEIKDTKDLNLYKFEPAHYTALFFNINQTLLKNKSFREAIASGIDKRAIIDEVLFGHGKEVNSSILEDFAGYTQKIRTISYNPENAKKILASLGYIDKNNDGLYEKAGKTLELNLVTSDTEEFSEIAQKIQSQLSSVGIKINIINVDSLTIQTDYIFPSKFDLLLFGENLGTDTDPYPFWHSSQAGGAGLNITGYSNSEVDKLLEEARVSCDNKVRKEHYKRFSQIIADDAPTVFLYQPLNYMAANSIVKGIKNGKVAEYSDKIYQVSSWYTQVGRVKK